MHKYAVKEADGHAFPSTGARNIQDKTLFQKAQIRGKFRDLPTEKHFI